MEYGHSFFQTCAVYTHDSTHLKSCLYIFMIKDATVHRGIFRTTFTNEDFFNSFWHENRSEKNREKRAHPIERELEATGTKDGKVLGITMPVGQDHRKCIHIIWSVEYLHKTYSKTFS